MDAVECDDCSRQCRAADCAPLIVFTRLRPGEKLSEELVGKGDVLQASHVEGVGWVEAPRRTDWTLFDRDLAELERPAAAPDCATTGAALVELELAQAGV